MTKKDNQLEQDQIGQALRYSCDRKFGVLEGNFLCQSISILNPKTPLCVSENESIEEVVKKLQEHKIGCVLVTDSKGKLIGIFSERDCLLKVLGKGIDMKTTKVSTMMTPDPISQPPDGGIGYVLNLMCQGGFRHIPIVDREYLPVGIISVKDVIDYIVKTMVEDLLNFELPA